MCPAITMVCMNPAVISKVYITNRFQWLTGSIPRVNLAVFCLNQWKQCLGKSACSVVSIFVAILMWKVFDVSKLENGAFGGKLLIRLDFYNAGSKCLGNVFESWVMIKDYQLWELNLPSSSVVGWGMRTVRNKVVVRERL